MSGEITREDVADCVASIIISRSIPRNVTFEVYETDKTYPLLYWSKQKFKYTKYVDSNENKRNGKVFDNYEHMVASLKSDYIDE